MTVNGSALSSHLGAGGAECDDSGPGYRDVRLAPFVRITSAYQSKDFFL